MILKVHRNILTARKHRSRLRREAMKKAMSQFVKDITPLETAGRRSGTA